LSSHSHFRHPDPWTSHADRYALRLVWHRVAGRPQAVTAIGICEKRLLNVAWAYATEILDLDRHRLLGVIEGRSYPFGTEIVGDWSRNQPPSTWPMGSIERQCEPLSGGNPCGAAPDGRYAWSCGGTTGIEVPVPLGPFRRHGGFLGGGGGLHKNCVLVVGAFGDQQGDAAMAEVVEPHRLADRIVDGGEPDTGAEGAAADGTAFGGGEDQSVGS